MSQTYTADEAGLSAALAALGADRDAVAETLRAGGYRGKPGKSDSCPVARYLCAVTGCFEASVDDAHAEVLIDGGYRYPQELAWRTVDTPDPVAEFVQEFDQTTTVYADLVAS